MAFNNEIRVLNTSDTNHADNFNEPLQELLENTQFNANQIGVLSEDRGYLTSKLIPVTTDIDTVTENGFYIWEYGENSKKPNGAGAYYFGVNKITKDYIIQEATMSWGSANKYVRIKENGIWGTFSSDSDEITALQETDIALPYLVKDFNSIPFNKRHIRSEASIPNAPTVGQFTGIQTAWDDTFKMVLGIDIFGGLFYRKGFDKWNQVATTDKIDISLLNGWSNYNGSVKATIIGDLITITGVISGGSNVESVVVGNISPGYRPKAIIMPRVSYQTGFEPFASNFRVYTDGNIQKIDGVTAEKIDFSFSYHI